MTRKWRHWLWCVLIAAGSTLCAWSLSKARFFEILNLKAYDTHFIFRGKQPTSGIILITADQYTMDKFPELRLFWNKHYADAIQAASEAGAKVIGFDVAFGIPIDQWKPGYDEALAGAVASSAAPVVCAYATELNSNPLAQAIPINMAAAGLGLSAYANLTEDVDLFIRRQELLERPPVKPDDPPPAHSLALRIVEKALGTDAQMQDGKLVLNGRTIPISSDRSVAINYAGPPNTFPSVSLAKFEERAQAGDKEQLRKWVQGKIVLIGGDSIDDRRSTPFYTLLKGNQFSTSGVEIHANVVRTLLSQLFILPVSQGWRIFALLLATLLTVWIATEVPAGKATGLILIEILAILATTHLLFLAGWVLSTSEMLAATLICLIASVIYRFATEQSRGNLFHRAIALFVGKQVAKTLDETDTIALSGKCLTVTILFTDIRGFTAFAEEGCAKEGPEYVVKLLNEYLAIMVAVIVKYHGHVNKFIGDGVLAIFCDEDEGVTPGDHALRTVLCATEIVSLPSRFRTGAGIHTGMAVLGNVGSADKMEYTALGDTVNLASRLENLNKERNTRLLMSAATMELLHNQVELTHLGTEAVRGKALPIDLYTVASLVPQAVNV